MERYAQAVVVMTIKRALSVQKAQLFHDRFESIADAAASAMFSVDGRIDDTPSARVTDDNEIVATRAFKAQLRRELKRRNFEIWAKHRERA